MTCDMCTLMAIKRVYLSVKINIVNVWVHISTIWTYRNLQMWNDKVVCALCCMPRFPRSNGRTKAVAFQQNKNTPRSKWEGMTPDGGHKQIVIHTHIYYIMYINICIRNCQFISVTKVASNSIWVITSESNIYL